MQNSKTLLPFEPFDCRRIQEYSEQIIEFSIEKAECYINNQLSNLTEIDNKTTTILGWLIAGISALIGYLVIYISSNSSNWKILVITIVALVVMVIATSILVGSNIYKRSSYPPGVDPDIFFKQSVCLWANEHYPTTAEKMIKANYLQVLQDRIIYNSKETHHRIIHYRRALYVICFGIAVALGLTILFCVL